MSDSAQTATLTAVPFRNGKQVRDARNEQIEVKLETTTDCPDEALGQVVGEALRQAWKTGLDPAKDNFYIALHFS
jgi:hypothetical protein